MGNLALNLYNDNDPRIAAWMRGLVSAGLVPHGIVDGRCISELSAGHLSGFTQCHLFCGIGGWPEALQLAGWPANGPVWTASLPCQPWSISGRGLGEEDSRHLAPQFLALTKVCNPTIIFGEQVASADALRWLDGLFFHLENQGYTCAASDLCSAGVGAIHIRQRLFWIAHSKCFRVPGLEQAGDSGAAGQGWTCGAEDLHAFVDRPFMDSASWPKPLVRASDDGLCRKRVAGCHGAGNAIMPQVAAQFILASLEAIAETQSIP